MNPPERRFCRSCGAVQPLLAGGSQPGVLPDGGDAGPGSRPAVPTPPPEPSVGPAEPPSPTPAPAQATMRLPWETVEDRPADIVTVPPPVAPIIEPPPVYVPPQPRVVIAQPPPVVPSTRAGGVGLPISKGVVAGVLAGAVVVVLGFVVANTILKSDGTGASPAPSIADGGGGGQTVAPSQGSSATSAPASPTEAASGVPTGLTVGDFSGAKPADAKAALAALCQPSPCVTVAYEPEQSSDVPFREVVRTEPAPGGQIDAGAVVTVYVSVADMSVDGAWYEVAKGDLFSLIANEHGFKPWQDLKPFNPGIDYDRLEVGDLIWIPAGH